MYTFERAVVFTFQGVSSHVIRDELRIVVPDPVYSCSVALVDTLEGELLHADREQAVRAGMLRGVTYRDEEFDDVLAEVRETRPTSAEYVVVRIREPAMLDLSQKHVEFEDLVVGFELASKDEYRRKTAHLSAVAGAALAVVASPGARPTKVVDSVYFFDSSLRAYYVSNVTFGDISVSWSWGTAQIEAFERICHAISRDVVIDRPLRLLASTLNPDADSFEKFVALWTALEIMVNKLFPQYCKQILVEQVTLPVVPGDVMERLRHSKAKLLDKFTVVASCLNPDGAQSDVRAFKSIKDFRDQLFHAGEATDERLPNDGARELVVRYLSAHLERS